MKQVDKMPDRRLLEVARMLRIGNAAVAKAKDENKRLGIPEAIFIHGNMYLISQDGSIQLKKKSLKR